MIRRCAAVLLSIGLAGATLLAQQPAPQNEYVPMKELPPGEQMAAAPLLVAAYAFIWVAVMVYVFTIWRRLNKVEADMQVLARRSDRR